MAFWNVDLTTYDGADGAAQVGALACFISAGLGLLGLIAVYPQLADMGMAATSILAISLAFVVVEAIVYIVAAFRFRAGKGLIWGSVAALWLMVDLLPKLYFLFSIVTPFTLAALVINALLLVGVVTGVRGAYALRHRGPDLGNVDGVFD